MSTNRISAAPAMLHVRRLTTAACLAVAVAGALPPAAVRSARAADDPMISYDAPRGSRDPNEPGLTRTALQRGFGELFDAPLDGVQVYAQPVVVGNTVIVATERDHVYGFDAATCAKRWEQSVTAPRAPCYEPSSQVACDNVTPDLGATATPVADPDSNTGYVSARSWDGQNGNSAKQSVHGTLMFGQVDRRPEMTAAPSGSPAVGGSASHSNGIGFRDPASDGRTKGGQKRDCKSSEQRVPYRRLRILGG